MNKPGNSYNSNGQRQQPATDDSMKTQWLYLSSMFPGLLPELQPALAVSKPASRKNLKGSNRQA